MKKFWFLSFIAFIATASFAQRSTKLDSLKIKANLDSISTVKTSGTFMEKLDSLHYTYIGVLDSLNQINSPRYIDVDPHYYKLYMPLTFYKSAVEQTFFPKWKSFEYQPCSYSFDTYLPYDQKVFTQYRDADKIVNRGLLYVYAHDYAAIKKWDYKIEGMKIFYINKEQIDTKDTHMIALFKPDPEQFNKIKIKIHKPNFWEISGNGSLQFSQSYISDNWYKGGESTNAMLSALQIDANYNDKNKWEWDNRLELKLGFQTAQSDTIHKYKINDNLLRLTSKIGLQATTHWYYTLSFEFNTQLTNAYNSNATQKQSGFMAPANLITSLGMDYKKKSKKIDLSAVFAPAAYNLKYVNGNNIDVTTFGIKAGKHSLTTIGSTMTTNLVVTLNSAVSYTTRLYYFSNYQSTQAEWENTINFVLNRYLSTKVFFHGRFDDSVTKSSDWKYFQFKDLVSFGINYAW